MASDASRRWLNGSNIWSCRIKLPASPIDAATPSQQQTSAMAPAAGPDVPLESTSPSSRRNKGKLMEAVQSLSNLNNNMEIDLPTDPDAQATVTDFLDFTEYLPSDIIRSLTLIQNLDQTYLDYSGKVDSLTKKYGELPSLPREKKMDPVVLRREVSENLGYAVSVRTLSHAEAVRMANNVDRHYGRIKSILVKLQKMQENYPATRENSPEAKAKSPVSKPKLTLRLDGSRPGVRKHRAPRITVPGEVLAPYELDYESWGSESEEDYSDNTPRITPALSIGVEKKKIKLTIPKLKKERSSVPKPSRGPRPPGVMGTNVHSAVAGISTSNALAKLDPPPVDAVKGDTNLPWLQLNAWELALLRKRMKKNAIWSPSDTMIARELKQLGRGIEAYRSAKGKAEAAGVEFITTEPPQLRGETVHAEGAISVEALKASEPQLSNRGMKLNEAKKLKKENQAKELAKQAADEAEASAAVMASTLGEVMSGLFAKPAGARPAKRSSKTPAKKRKRESSAIEGVQAETETKPPLKRNKTETPIPVPITTKSSTIIVPEMSSSSRSSTSYTPAATPLEAPANGMTLAPLKSPKKSSTPILPPVKDKKIVIKKETKKSAAETAANTRPRRTSGAPTPTPELPPKRPTSSRSNAEATATLDRPRRASTARNTPAPEPKTNKRTKRPVPGAISTSSEGSTTVEVTKRSKATKKSKGQKKRKVDENGRQGSEVQEVFEEIDDEGNVIPADEPRYCVCNRVSFGTMIACENDNCEKEWFHLECVNLLEIPPRTTKWYCPDCRVNLKIGDKGVVNARGKKK